MKRIDQDIKNREFAKVYLLHGTQDYLKSQYCNKLVKAILGENDSMNYSYYNGHQIPLREIIDLAETMPFLAERRVIVLDNSGLFVENKNEKKLDDKEVFEEYLSTIPDSTTFIFVEAKIDARLKITKTAKAAGVIAEFADLSEENLRTWVINRLAASKTNITGRALELFLEGCGTDMLFISNELEKLIAYAYGKEGIYPEDVEAVCSARVEDKVFLMLDEMFRRNIDGALKYYADLLELQVAPQKILVLIEGQIRLIYHIKLGLEQGYSVAQVANILEVKEYRVKKALPHANKSSKIWLKDGLELCADVDAKSKSGLLNAQVGLEMIICTLAGHE